MENGDWENIFGFLSKLTIIIPLVIIVVVLLIKINQKNKAFFLPQDTKKVTPTLINMEASSGAKFNLTGPLTCHSNTSSASISAYIKNKNIFVKKDSEGKAENYLVTGDCFYHWDKDKFIGEKTCGLSSLLPFADLLTNLNLVSLDSLMKFFPQIEGDSTISSNEAYITNLVKSCQKQEVDDRIFIVPANVLFKNMVKLSPSAGTQ